MMDGHENSTANGVRAADGLFTHTATPTSSLIELAQTILREAEKLDKRLKECGSAMPSFDVEAPTDFLSLPNDIQRTRQKVVEAAKELGDLVMGPAESIRWMAWDVSLSFRPPVSDAQQSLNTFADLG